MIRLYAITALCGALAAGGGVWWITGLQADLAASQARVDALTLRLAGCTARADNLTEDKDRDNEIDRLNDDDLRNAFDDWMLPPLGSSGSIY